MNAGGGDVPVGGVGEEGRGGGHFDLASRREREEENVKSVRCEWKGIIRVLSIGVSLVN